MKKYFGNKWRHERFRMARKRLVRFNPIIRVALQHTDCLLAANADTERAFRQMGMIRVIRHLETAAIVPTASGPPKR